MTSSFTLDNPSNPTDGQIIVWKIKHDGTTNAYTIGFGTAFKLGTDIPSITLSATANTTDYLEAVYNADESHWDITAFIRGF